MTTALLLVALAGCAAHGAPATPPREPPPASEGEPMQAAFDAQNWPALHRLLTVELDRPDLPAEDRARFTWVRANTSAMLADREACLEDLAAYAALVAR